MTYTFVSGATGGIGKAFCVNLIKNDENLVITGRSEEKLIALKNELSAINPKPDVLYFACDAANEESRKTLLSYIDEKQVKFNRVINVAGVDIQKAFTLYTEEKLLNQLRVNAEGTMHLTYALLNKRTEKAEFLAISSMSGVTPMPYFALYSASKAFVTSLYTSLHYELKKQGVKVTVVMPGGVPTRPDIIEDIKKQGLWGKLSSVSAEKVAKKSLKALEKNKVKFVPGFFNKFLYFIMKLIPQRLQLRFISKRWSKISKDAF